MEKSKKKKVVFVTLVVIVLCSAVAISCITTNRGRTTSSRTYTEEEIKNDSNGKDYSIKKQGVTYTFHADGILTVSGTGSTKSFATAEEAQRWYLEELFYACAGAYPERTEQLIPFTQLLNRVTQIEVKEGITGLGDVSFAPFYYVETVSVPETLRNIGCYTFLGTGQYADGELVLFGREMSEIEYSTLSFLNTVDGGMVAFDGRNIAEEELTLRTEEEQGTVPEESLLEASVAMGDNIAYRLYENGVLYVTGFGDTYDFAHYSEMEQYIMEELHLVSRLEAKELWFDRVAEIVLEDGIDRIGDNALAQYKNALAVSGSAPESLGSRAFFRLGIDTISDTIWHADFEDTVTEEDSFAYCKTLPLSRAERSE